MSELPSQVPEELMHVKDEGEFTDPEAQEHMEAITDVLPLYYQYHSELSDRYNNVASAIEQGNLSAEEKSKLETERSKLSFERDYVGMQIKDLSSEVRSVSNAENNTDDFINGWRQRLGLQSDADDGLSPEEINSVGRALDS